jgi:hypothetical protein
MAAMALAYPGVRAATPRRVSRAPRAVRGGGSVGPPVADELAVAAIGAVGAERDDLEAVRAALEPADDREGDADAVPALEVDHLVAQAHPAGTADDDAALLLLAVGAAEADAEVVGAEVLAPEARLARVTGTLGGGVLDVVEVLEAVVRRGGRQRTAARGVRRPRQVASRRWKNER